MSPVPVFSVINSSHFFNSPSRNSVKMTDFLKLDTFFKLLNSGLYAGGRGGYFGKLLHWDAQIASLTRTGES